MHTEISSHAHPHRFGQSATHPIQPRPTVASRLNGTQPVIVFGSSIGGTPVVMDRADSRPAVPLSVGVREGAGGCAEVLLADAARDSEADRADFPAEVTDDLAAPPKWVGRALM